MPRATRPGDRPRGHRRRHPPRPHRPPVRPLIRPFLGILFTVFTAFGLGYAPALQPSLPGGAEGAYKAIRDRVDGAAAMDIVRFMDPFWRISGNPGFNASVDRIRDGLQPPAVPPPLPQFPAPR